MTPDQLSYAFITVVVVGAIVGLLHERRAMTRERNNEARHSELMKAVADNRALTLAAITQRNALAERVSALEAWREQHDSNPELPCRL